jgi:molybdopterin converting factor subunit 1
MQKNKMKVTVQLFAILREAVGANQIDLEVPAETTARQITQILAERFPKFRPHLNTLSFAINGEIVPAETKAAHACEIALLPPVSGG